MSGAATPPPEEADGGGWYVYGVVAASEADELVGTAGGVDATHPVMVVADENLGAIVSGVALDEFGEGVLEENLRDGAWLEEKVRAHEAVLEAALRLTAVVPFRFGTIYSRRQQVLGMLAAHEADFRAALERVRGRIELGVKAFLDLERFAERRLEAGGPDEPHQSGRAYLLRKQLDRRLAEAAGAFASDCARVSHDRLAQAADDGRANPLQRPEVAGGPGQMVLNGAYLVRAENQELFRAALAELESRYAPDGVVYVLTGPWPPYNFVDEPGER